MAPVVVGGLGLVGVGQGVKSGVENAQQGNNWSAAFDFGTAALAAAPFATKGGRGAMFGEQARTRTAQTAGQVWNGARNLPNRALNAADDMVYGARVLASELSPPMVTPEGVLVRPPMPEAPTPRPLRMQGDSPEGLQGTGGTTATQERRGGVLETSEPQVATPTHTPENQPAPGSRTASEPIPTYETPYKPLSPKQRKLLKEKVENRGHLEK